MDGVVKKVMTDKGFGWIQGPEKDYFFHRSALKNIKFENLKEGAEVTFEDAESDKGPRAEDIYV